MDTLITLIATVVFVFVVVMAYTVIAYAVQEHKIKKALRKRDAALNSLLSALSSVTGMESKNSKHWRESTPAAR